MADLISLQEQYTTEIGKLPNSKKNDAERIQAKLDEKRNPASNEPTESVEPTSEPKTEPTESVTPEVESVESIDTNDNRAFVPTPEEPKTNEKHISLLQIQAFHGITNEELYNDDTLKKKYKLSKDELMIIRSYTKKANKDIDLNLNYHEMPDYIQVLFNKYGITGDTLKDIDKLKEIIFQGSTTPTDAQKLELHQMVEYYNKLRQDATVSSSIVENPALKNPSTGWDNIPAL